MRAGPGALVVGCVSGAHGVQGALRLHLFDPASRSLRAGLEVTLRASEGEEAGRFVVERLVPKPGSAIVRLWLRGVDSREAAEVLKGLDLWIDREDLPALASDEFYLADMIGLRVERVREDHGGAMQPLGTIAAVTSNGAQDLFEVAYGGSVEEPGARTWLLPVLPQFLREVSEERVVVELPEGLLPDCLESP